MAVVTRNIDGSTPWVKTDNPNSVRITYDNGGTEQAAVLTAVDEWLTGFIISSVTSTTVVITVAIPATTVPTSGATFSLRLYDASTGITSTYPCTSWAGSTFTVTGFTSAYTSFGSDTLDRVAIVGGYGDRGWHPVGVSGTTIRSYKALNVGGAEGVAQVAGYVGGYVANYKWMVIDVASAGYIYTKCYEWVSGVTGTTLADRSATAGNTQRFTAAGVAGALYISASERHFLCYGAGTGINGSTNSGGMTGIIEFHRAHLTHTLATGAPPYGYWNSHFGTQSAATQQTGMFTPRSVYNETTTQVYSGLSSAFTASGFIGGSTSVLPFAPTADPLTGKLMVSDAVLYQSNASGPTKTVGVGRLYNIKVIGGGGYLDETIIPIDGDGFVSASGSNTRFLLFSGISTTTVYNIYSIAVPK